METARSQLRRVLGTFQGRENPEQDTRWKTPVKGVLFSFVLGWGKGHAPSLPYPHFLSICDTPSTEFGAGEAALVKTWVLLSRISMLWGRQRQTSE